MKGLSPSTFIIIVRPVKITIKNSTKVPTIYLSKLNKKLVLKAYTATE